MKLSINNAEKCLFFLSHTSLWLTNSTTSFPFTNSAFTVPPTATGSLDSSHRFIKVS